MSVDVKQQIRIRGAHRAYVSKLLNRVPEVAPDDEEQIELLRISLKGKLSVLEDLDKSILELIEEGNIDKEIEESEGIKDEIHLNLLKLDSLLKNWRHLHNLRNILRCLQLLKLQGQCHIQPNFPS